MNIVPGERTLPPKNTSSPPPQTCMPPHGASPLKWVRKSASFSVGGRAILMGNHWVSSGKCVPNGIAKWGATLYDFYRVDPIPGVNPGQVAETKVASGSLIAAAMRELGEDGAVDELEWADREPDPCELPVMNTQKLIEAHRCRVHSGMYNHVSVVDEVRAQAIGGRGNKQQPSM